MDQLLRFTLPFEVARQIDLDAIERLAATIDAPTFHRRETAAGIEIGCSEATVAIIVGALSDAATDRIAMPAPCADSLATLLALLTTRRAATRAPSYGV